MFSLNFKGIELLEAARAALGHGVVLSPRREHEEEKGKVGDKWVAELMEMARKYNTRQDTTTLPHLVVTPEGGVASYENSLSHIEVGKGWEINFGSPSGQEWAFRAIPYTPLYTYLGEQELKKILQGVVEDEEKNAFYRLRAYRGWFEAILNLLEEPKLLEKVQVIFAEAEEALAEKEKKYREDYKNEYEVQWEAKYSCSLED